MVVCEQCGSMLQIDKNLDHQQFIETEIASHLFRDCPRAFTESDASAKRSTRVRALMNNSQGAGT